MTRDEERTQGQTVTLGRINGLFGIEGWVKVYSYTEPREGILDYPRWLVRTAGGWRELWLEEGRRHGTAVLARLEGCRDRDAAARLMGAEIAVPRSALPELAEDEYYWVDLLGLAVVTTDGVELGRVDSLMETGANDVLVVAGERERLIPFLPGETVRSVALDRGEIVVDWDPEF